MVSIRSGHRAAIAVLLLPAGCATAVSAADTTPPTAPPDDTSSAPEVRDVMDIEHFAPLEPGTYSIDPDLDPATPLRVVYEIPAEGWTSWIGAAKFSDVGHVGVTITTVTNVVRDGCHVHSWADPPIGPTVDDLAAALADLSPFRVTSPPEDVSIYGFSGTHLEWVVPDLPVEGPQGDSSFIGCSQQQLKSWVAAVDTEPGDAFYGYTGPRYTEEFWILDVDGTRLMIATGHSPDSPTEDLDEMLAILDSIRIEP